MLTERTMVRLDKAMKKKLEVLAQKENRSLSNLIRDVLLKYVKEVKSQDRS